MLGYKGMHKKVRKERGPASDYICDYCIKQAQDWAYKGTKFDDNPIKTIYQGRLTYYSLDVWMYISLCRSCHAKHDNYNSGEKNSQSKLIQDSANEIREAYMYDGDVTIQELADMYNVHFSQIYRVINNERWTANSTMITVGSEAN